MHPAFKTAMASALALATVVPAAAQGDPNGSPYRPTDTYTAQQQQYDAQLGRYQAQRDDYRDQSADYRAARSDYERRMSDWEARRASYDARYGAGAYARSYPAPAWDDQRWASAGRSDDYRAARADYDRRMADWDTRRAEYDRRYGDGAYARIYPAPAWDDQRWASAGRSDDYRAARADYDRRMADWEAHRADYDRRYGYGAYVRAYGPAPVWDDRRWASSAPAAAYSGRDAAYTAPIRCNNNSAVTAGIIGALAGSVLGSNVAARGRRTEGAVLGGVVGAGVGAAIGHANDKYKCDGQGAYWTYNDSVPYRVSDDIYRDDRYADYSRRRCRLAPAPVTDSDYRYVRVCPDGRGRYRVTG
jgi:hypothetical protein